MLSPLLARITSCLLFLLLGSVSGSLVAQKSSAVKLPGQALGYLNINGVTDLSPALPLLDASDMMPDKSLVGQPLSIQLHSLVLPQLPEKPEPLGLVLDLRVPQTLPATGQAITLHQVLPYWPKSAQGVVLPGRLLFSQLQPPGSGLSLQVRAVSVAHPEHVPLLYSLDDDAVQAPFPLAASCSQAVQALSALHENLARLFRTHPDNQIVWNSSLYLGLGGDPAQAKLRTGTYVLVLVDDLPNWSWEPWHYLRESGLLVHRDTGNPLPLPHLLFSIQTGD